MLEILILWALTKRIGSIVEQKGHKSGSYKVLTVVLWFGGEIIGAIVGVMMAGADESAQCLIYIVALGGAAVGAGISYLIADNLAPVRPTSPLPERQRKSAKSFGELCRDLQHDHELSVRCEAAEALGESGNAQAIEPLISALGDKDGSLRSRAVEALGKLGDERAIEPLVRALEDEDFSVRYNAAEALGKIGPEAVPALIQALGDGNKDVRRAAVLALGKIGSGAKGAVPTLIHQALGDGNMDVRRIAAWALGEIGSEAKEAVPTLIQALGDEDKDVRVAAVKALGKIGLEAKEAVPALIQALGDEDWSVRWRAAEALKAITGQDLGEDTARWQQWWERQRQ